MQNYLISEAIGDIAGSAYEGRKYRIKDYDKVKELMPDFSPAWYNSGHVYVRQQNYQSALDNFSKSITLTPSFAEAYFNRGLTHIYLKKRDEGISDLSKAGELGLYSSYNVIKRFGGNR